MSNSNGKMINISISNIDGKKSLQIDENEKFECLLSKISYYKEGSIQYAYDGLLINGVFYEIPNKDLAGKLLKDTPIKDGSSLSWYCKEVDFIPRINIESADTNLGGSQARNEIKTTFKDPRNLTDPWNFKDAWNYDYKKYRDNYFFRLKNKDRRLSCIYKPHPTYIQSIKNCATQTGIPIASIQVKPHVINNSLAGYRQKYYSASLSSNRYKQIAYQEAILNVDVYFIGNNILDNYK